MIWGKPGIESIRNIEKIRCLKKPIIKQLEEKIRRLESESSKNRHSEKILLTLYDISDAITKTESLKELYASIYKSLNNLLNLPNFYIALYDSKTKELHFAFFIDQFDDYSDRGDFYKKSFYKTPSLTGEVIQKKEALFLTEEMLIQRAKDKRIIGTPPLVYIGIPLMIRDKIIGVIAVQSYSDPNYFDREDMGMLISVSNQIASAIDRKRNLEQIDVLQNYLFNIINSMPSILIGVNKEKIVTQWNYQAAIEIGLEAEAAVGKAITKVFPRLSNNIELIDQAIRIREIKTRLKQRYIKDGKTRYEDLIIYPLVTNGIEGVVIRIDDATEQVQMEEMIVQSEKMLSVGGLAAGMAHEINNPLAGMMQTASVMGHRLTDLETIANTQAADAAGISMEAIHDFMVARDIPRMIATIKDSGQRVAELVENMLSFARKTNANILPHDPVELLDKTLGLAATEYDLDKQYDFKTIDIIKEYEDNLPQLNCESPKIQQVLLNILRNGAQAMQEKYNQNIDYKPQFILRIRRDADPGMLRIEIEDNGPGMDSAICKRVFEPFFTTKPAGLGTGLGLSVSYFIVTENHGGNISVASIPGVGTNFIISLPLKEGVN